MANTAIRLGYISTTSGGGGAGFEEYANLAAFPPVGEEGTIYLASDTKKIYVWTGSAYEEMSSSEDKANRNLDNLIQTSIPDGVGLNSLATSNFHITTIDKEDSTATVRISSGDSTVAGDSGDIILSVGEVTSGNKGNIELNSKNITANVDYYSALIVRNQAGESNVNISTTGFGTPDNPQINFNGVSSSGVAAIQAFSKPNNNGGTTHLISTMIYANTDGNYNGGDLNLTSGANAFQGITADNSSVSSGNINISTSNAFTKGSATDANSGNIVIQTGNKEGSGTRGYVSLSGSHINANLAQIKNVADGTNSNDAINLSQLNSAISPLEGISEVLKFHVFENNAGIYADGMPGIRDTSTLIRDGWYFQNATGQKINWYFFDGNPLSSTYQGAITQANFNAYVVMTLDNKNSKPIMALYSLPTGSGDVIPGFAHSRWVYELSTAALSPLLAGTKYLFYIGTNPPVHPELQHVALDLVPIQSVGDKNPAELILTAALNSNSGEPAGEVSWMVESLGVFSPTRKQEMELRIRTVPLNSASKIDAIYLPSYVDDVLEYANLATFPVTGETGKIYVALDTNKIYRWSGSAYIEISPGAIPPVLSVNTKTGHVVLDKTDIGLGNVDNTSDLNKPISTATQTALNLKYDASNPAGYITAAEVPESPVLSVNQQTGNVFLDKYDIGLENVDNTSDLDKPISTATQTALDGKANTNLNNLVATAIPDGVNLESLSTNTSFTTGFQVRTKTQTTSNSGAVRVISGDVTGDFTSGGARVWSGNNINAQRSNPSQTATGVMTFLSGSISSGTGSTGNILLNTGNIFGGSSQGNTGPLYGVTGINEGTGNTGSVVFSSGNAQNGNSGDIILTTGEASGTRGKLNINASLIDINNIKITELANGVALQDAVNVSQLNAILDYTPADASDWTAPVPDDVKEALDQLADRLESGTGVNIDAFSDMKEPTGFFNRTDSSISLSYNSGTNTVTFSIQPTASSFQVYVKGTKYTKSALESVSIISPTAGIHYLYYNPSGVLSTTSTFSSSLFEDNALVSLFYWNTDTNTYSYFAEERHGLTMDGATHAYLHTVFGARYLSGLALQSFTIGDGSLNAHAQFTADSGSIRDEDLLLSIPAQLQIPVLFRQGQLWRKKTADAYPVIYSGSADYTGANQRIPYNQFVGGNWQLTEVDQNKFVLVHLFATNDKETPIVAIQGINQYNDVPSARNAANTEITTLSGLPFAEFAAIGTVIFQTVDSYTNDVNARVVPINSANYVDFRGTQLYTPAGEATTHSLLSGLAGDDHFQYHNDARGDLRYNLKSAGDISETSYSITNSQTSAHNITGFAFDNAIVRSFEAEVSIKIDADLDLFEKVSISGIQKGSDWEIAVRSLGDSSGVVFSITSAGQLQYTSLNYTGFVSGTIKFRAITTSV